MAGWIKEQLDKPRAAITDDSAPDPKSPQSLRYLGKAIAMGAKNIVKMGKDNLTGGAAETATRASNRYRSR